MSTPMVAASPVMHARNSSRLAGRGGTKTMYLTYPHTAKSKGVKSGYRGGQAIVFLCPIHDDWQNFEVALHEWNAIWRFG